MNDKRSSSQNGGGQNSGGKAKTAITPTREEDYPEWYQQVVKASELAEGSPVRGCMIIRPWGYGIWERVQQELDNRIKATGHENAYFPLLIPLSFLEREAQHVEGFAKECAVVTHHRLEERNGKLVPTGELEEPLIIRPTSETIIGDAFSRWVQSYRDLPLLVNQWANVMRWEMRTRLFLRTSEFLWQEGHTVHATHDEAQEETLKMLEVYREVAEDVLAMPVITGEKSAGERFPGADHTYSIEAMMQDRKALQAGTSHNLGQNFSKAQNIRFLDEKGELQFAHTTSWGVSTRLVGGVVMTHADDDGLRVPPLIAPKHVVILPVIPKETERAAVLEYADTLRRQLAGAQFRGAPVRVVLDDRDLRGGDKSWQWIKKGIPLRIEVGPRDIQSGNCVVYRRDQSVKEKTFLPVQEVVGRVGEMLEEIQSNLFSEAKRFRDENMITSIQNFADLQSYFTPKNADKPEIHGGFVVAPWCEDSESEKRLSDLKLSIRCIPFNQDQDPGTCILTGKPAKRRAVIAKAY
ncbi:MAG: proline--tRNA ligase [Bdellovibrionales bacterium]|nr:proline--tRNA ligase [Bdellovibrionales bacterium]